MFSNPNLKSRQEEVAALEKYGKVGEFVAKKVQKRIDQISQPSQHLLPKHKDPTQKHFTKNVFAHAHKAQGALEDSESSDDSPRRRKPARVSKANNWRQKRTEVDDKG